ncbi:hypothetical protein SAMN05660706_13914 [Desulfoscipio geothermicus DSM 3669]|uniref:Uncharacterized protein n=1 Tax=Desulfoscipio geothermicus DSM 3669 TaxID=1121426 RepID=A0A1I6EFK3_9FIRM|nr:hypothetical protein SAMN05660706_13914 [Desulfoscipio geothermicus DSM 3669]
MPDNSHFFNNPPAAVILLMAADTPNPVQRLNALSQTLTV